MSDAVRARREAILGAAGAELARGRMRRQRRARVAGAACIAAIGAVALFAAVRGRDGAAKRFPAASELAIDFAAIGAEPVSLDFAVAVSDALALDFAIAVSQAPALDFTIASASPELAIELVPDGELRKALQECGYCVDILRLDGQTMLVDCSTGLRQVIRER
ncbi:MAG: hypothetical protein ACKOYN_03520 [Planctomycetota bacterium]